MTILLVIIIGAIYDHFIGLVIFLDDNVED